PSRRHRGAAFASRCSDWRSATRLPPCWRGAGGIARIVRSSTSFIGTTAGGRSRRSRPACRTSRSRCCDMRHITFIRPNLGEGPSADAMTPLVFAILRARTPREIATTLIDERIEPLRPVATDLVAMTVETFTARRAYEIAAMYRRAGVPVVVG